MNTLANNPFANLYTALDLRLPFGRGHQMPAVAALIKFDPVDIHASALQEAVEVHGVRGKTPAQPSAATRSAAPFDRGTTPAQETCDEVR
ncbi:MAG: hypothetical protein ACYDDO_05715 [Acidiferrobacterales bacterium]